MIGAGNRTPASAPGFSALFSSAMPSEPRAVTIRSAVKRGTASESTEREVTGRSADRPMTPRIVSRPAAVAAMTASDVDVSTSQPASPTAAAAAAVTSSRARTMPRRCSVSRMNTAGSLPGVFIADRTARPSGSVDHRHSAPMMRARPTGARTTSRSQ